MSLKQWVFLIWCPIGSFGLLTAILCLFWGEITGYFTQRRHARRMREAIQQARDAVKYSEVKAPILKIGTLRIMDRSIPHAPSIHIDGWAFKIIQGLRPAHEVKHLGTIYMGYSTSELIEIHCRRAEFEQPEAEFNPNPW